VNRLHRLSHLARNAIDRIGFPQVEAGPRWSRPMLRDGTDLSDTEDLFL